MMFCPHISSTTLIGRRGRSGCITNPVIFWSCAANCKWCRISGHYTSGLLGPPQPFSRNGELSSFDNPQILIWWYHCSHETVFFMAFLNTQPSLQVEPTEVKECLVKYLHAQLLSCPKKVNYNLYIVALSHGIFEAVSEWGTLVSASTNLRTVATVKHPWLPQAASICSTAQ